MKRIDNDTFYDYIKESPEELAQRLDQILEK